MSRAAAARELRILAPAKFNAGLAVLRRRPDGYHELRTLFQAVGLFDRLVLRRTRRGVSVRCPALPGLGEGNLAHRAAEVVLRETGAGGGLAIDLEKRIPAGGGLGGGSSDAAAVLLGASRLLGLRPERERLLGWAAQLGSDVPFFVDGGTALGAGRGERLEPLPPLPGAPAVLVYAPPLPLRTAEVYARVDPGALTGRTRALTILLARWRAGDVAGVGRALFNDLERPAFSLAPGLAAVKAALRGAGAAGALLSGSGSCVVGLFADGAAARRAAVMLRGRFPGRFAVARLLRARRRWGVVKR